MRSNAKPSDPHTRSSVYVSVLLLTAGLQASSLLAQKAGGESLYNGISLPAEWPVKNLDPASKEPMEVPYLKVPPKVIPIDVGRQLFIDDFLVEQTDLRQVFHLPQKYSGNPVLSATTQSELVALKSDQAQREAGRQQAVCYLGHGGAFYDPQEKLFSMFYTAGWRGGLAKAQSRDGIYWYKPDPGLGAENLVLPSGMDKAGGDNSVWLDLEATRPEERIKFLTERTYGLSRAERSAVTTSHTLHTIDSAGRMSAAVPAGKAADYCSFFYNPFRKVWVYSIKRDGPRGRTRYYAESPVFLTPQVFDRSVFWVGADRLDLPDPRIGDASQLYSLSAVAYESILLGAFQIHLGPKNDICDLGGFPKFTEIKLGFSRDGFHWHRPDRRAFIEATRRDGDWDRGYVHTTTGVCLVVGDKLYFPYTAYSGIGPDGRRGMYSGASIGMAMLRRDGFASMEASNGKGQLTTRLVSFKGAHLFVNLDTVRSGELRVEVLDEQGKVVPPFTAENCLPVSADSTIQEVTWRGATDLKALAGKPVRFRFHLKNGALYAFWVSPEKSGASHGYVGAGGPGFPTTVDGQGSAAYLAAKAVDRN
ncbi:MAG: hypothetical protein JNJ82_19830 [Opitutaceae bacterium]|nr:hypothetical protein [Opitutaceae bacterium]